MRKLPVFSGLFLSTLTLLTFSNVNTADLLRTNPNFKQVAHAVAEGFNAIDTLVFCTSLGNAELPPNNQSFLGEGHPDASSCSVNIWMMQEVTEPCGTSISYDVKLHLFDGVDVIQIIEQTEVVLDTNHYASLAFDTRSSSLPPDHFITLNGLPYTNSPCSASDGHHRLVWNVVNDCGGQSSFEYVLRIEDCEAPEPVCVGLSGVVFPISGQVTILANDFNAISFDDCTPADSLRYSFSAEAYEPSKRFDCNVLYCGPSVMVQIWAADQGSDLNCDGIIGWNERNKSACSTSVLFDDEQPCPDELLIFNGTIETEEQKPVSQVMVFLSAHGLILDQATTAGIFYFIDPCPHMPQTDLRIHCEKNDDHKNGVSTLDIVKIQKHLLGIRLLESPYKLIGADANNNGSISVLDLIEIRKLILGVFTEFPKSPSWRFVPKDYVFQNPENPWSFPDTLHVVSQGSNNFIGIKIGDVNGNVAPQISQVQDRKTRDVLSLSIDDCIVSKGQLLEVPVHGDVNDILGFQCTMRTPGLIYDGVEPGALDISSESVGVHPGAITMSWTNLAAFAEPASVMSAEALFTLNFTATADGKLSSMLKVTSDITKAEAYRDLKASEAPLSVEGDAELLDIALHVVRIEGLTVSDTLEFCVTLGNAELPSNNQSFLGEGNPDASSCSVHIWTTEEITDPCGGTITYSARVYPFSGTDFVQVIDSEEVQVDSNHLAVLLFDTRDNSLAQDHPIRQSGLGYTNRYCDGVPGVDAYHLIEWTISNFCGDTTFIEQYLRIDDCTIPQPGCFGLSSVVLPSNGEVTIWAKDFGSFGFDDCTANDDLLFSFSDTTYEPSRTFDCAMIEANGGPGFPVEIWVADEGRDQNCNGFVPPLGIEWNERNKGVCTTFLVIDDNEHACDSAGSSTPRITTPKGGGIKDVRVDFVQNGDTLYHVFTDADGYYSISLINPLFNYLVIPSKNDDPKNGVSTLDLVRIQKHLLGIQVFDSPFEYIAADANNSESVSALDLVEIRKLILGLYTEFPKNRSWRFVHASYDFPIPFRPWPFQETTEYTHSDFDGNFIGIKIGDVSGAAMVNASDVVFRNAKKLLSLSVEDQFVNSGQMIEVPVYGDVNYNLGFQFTMQTKGLDYIGIEPGALDISQECVGVHPGAITMSWASGVPATSVAHDALFTLRFIATMNGSLSTMLQITSDITEAEAYVPATSGPDGIDVTDIALEFSANEFAGTVSQEFALYQNVPNPFTDQTRIGFKLPVAMHAMLIVYDVLGGVVHKVEGIFHEGYNEIIVKGQELKADGVYYYRLSADDFTASKKFILSEE